MTLRTVPAIQWTCDECHDTGFERTTADALDALDRHRAEYHEDTPTDPDYMDPDELDPEGEVHWSGGRVL